MTRCTARQKRQANSLFHETADGRLSSSQFGSAKFRISRHYLSLQIIYGCKFNWLSDTALCSPTSARNSSRRKWCTSCSFVSGVSNAPNVGLPMPGLKCWVSNSGLQVPQTPDPNSGPNCSARPAGLPFVTFYLHYGLFADHDSL